MKKNICLLVFLTINLISAQTKSSDYFTLYKGGDKFLKPVKYVMFDSLSNGNTKVKENGLTYFGIKGERFKFDIKKDKKESCSLDILNKIKLEDPSELQNDGYKFFKKKKEEVEKIKKVKIIYPPAGFQSYFKIFILEKTKNGVFKYEVDWEYSDF
ncbi:hypothetical protein [Flavobacterium hydatis]|uniref:Uncharacterized protein n=1 Tax=Flavobacterium hydatis TaxID=991 RepID=A0A086ANZ7_FLAHY|nr:hypothetical protein [Flavobacterium hydatis]KFF18411.1 hypothetical protein IW20_05810 [Flavobacterium hydatis]OXA96841.1 hypothetical protein B0A62_06205 [Flavobacterium hydatis]